MTGWTGTPSKPKWSKVIDPSIWPAMSDEDGAERAATSQSRDRRSGPAEVTRALPCRCRPTKPRVLNWMSVLRANYETACGFA